MPHFDELTAVVTLAERNPEFVGHYLSEQDLRERFRCSGEQATLMRLCLLPRPQLWRDEIASIARIGNVDPAALEAVLTDMLTRDERAME